MDTNLRLSEKDKEFLKKSAGASLLAGAGAGILSRDVARNTLGLTGKIDNHGLPISNKLKIAEATKKAAEAGESADDVMSKLEMSPESLKELDKATLFGGVAGTVGTLAALTLVGSLKRAKKSYDKKAAERYNVDSAKNLALREAGFPSEDEDYYGKSQEIVPVLRR